MQPTTNLPYEYHAYGLNLVSDVELFQLSSGADPLLETITIQRTEITPRRPTAAAQVGPFAWCDTNYLYLEIPGVVQLVVQDGKSLTYLPFPGADDASVQLFLMGSGLGALLMQRKLLVLHGNAIEVEGACIMCVGPSGVGKSTTAGGLLKRGYRVMSDDICAIDAHQRIVPGMPHIKLWQEAANGLGIRTSTLKRVRPETEKFGVPLKDTFCKNVVPIKSVYVLTPHHSDEIFCETLKAQEKFMALRENTYRLPFVSGMGLGATHFQQLVELSKHVTVKRIKRPASGFQLDQLLDALIQDITEEKVAYA